MYGAYHTSTTHPQDTVHSGVQSLILILMRFELTHQTHFIRLLGFDYCF